MSYMRRHRCHHRTYPQRFSRTQYDVNLIHINITTSTHLLHLIIKNHKDYPTTVNDFATSGHTGN